MIEVQEYTAVVGLEDEIDGVDVKQSCRTGSSCICSYFGVDCWKDGIPFLIHQLEVEDIS